VLLIYLKLIFVVILDWETIFTPIWLIFLTILLRPLVNFCTKTRTPPNQSPVVAANNSNKRLKTLLSFFKTNSIWLLCVLLFFILLTIYLNGNTANFNLFFTFIPLFLLEFFVIIKFSLSLFRDGLGLRFESIQDRIRLIRLNDTRDIRLALTFFSLNLVIIGLVLFELFLCLYFDYGIMGNLIILPLPLAMFVLSFISLWSARTVYKMRIAAFNRQMLNYQDFI